LSYFKNKGYQILVQTKVPGNKRNKSETRDEIVTTVNACIIQLKNDHPVNFPKD
jgi:hypothetical protein